MTSRDPVLNFNLFTSSYCTLFGFFGSYNFHVWNEPKFNVDFYKLVLPSINETLHFQLFFRKVLPKKFVVEVNKMKQNPVTYVVEMCDES